VPDLFKKTLRFNPPVQLLFRNTTRDVELAGVKIRAGSLVMPLLGSANRDETKYSNPNVFDLSRKPKEIMSFGAGVHYCIGAQLARLEARLAIEILLERFAHITPQEPEISWTDTYIVRGPQRLLVRPETKMEPRHRCSSSAAPFAPKKRSAPPDSFPRMRQVSRPTTSGQARALGGK
jgi:cytochrome P450